MIIVCGEALIDLFVTMKAGALDVEAAAGGSPFNVALGLARLGRPVAYLGAISRDAFGEHLVDLMRRDGVDLRHLLRRDAPTTLSIVSAAADGAVSYAFHGEGGADRCVGPEDVPALPAQVRAVTVGSFSLAVEPCGSAFEAVALAAHAAGLVVSFDPNVRPALIADRAAWHGRFDRLAGIATILKISAEDIAHAFGADADADGLAQGWHEAGIPLVVLTRGAQPLLAYGAFGRLEVPAHPGPFIDAVGAGDAFHAALIAALDARGLLQRSAIAALSAKDARAALAFAARAAAIACGRRGADLPRLAELE